MKKLFLMILVAGLCGYGFAQTDKELAASTVDESDIKGHIYFLADDLLKGRGTGTPENKIAASYLANTLRRYGAKPASGSESYYQPFELVETRMPNSISLSINGVDYPLVLPFDITETDESGEAVFLGYGESEDIQNADIANKLVLFKAGSADTKDEREAAGKIENKRKLALEKGALGVVEFIDLPEEMYAMIKHSISKRTRFPREDMEGVKFPYLWVNLKNRELDFEKGKTFSFSLKSGPKEVNKITTQNVLGVIEGTDPKLKNEYIIYSAHYDHVGVGEPAADGDSIYNGARDNAIGTTAVLAMAENLGRHPTKRSALFIFFSAEEKGLLGSEYYVNNPVIPLEDVVYCFNNDGAGYNNTSLATIFGLGRTTAQKHIRNGALAFGLEAIDDPAPEQNLFDRSDNVSFAKKGIPAPTYSTGFNAFDDDIYEYYHQPGDEAETLDYDYLLKFYQGYIYSGRLIANDPEKPFWVKGDKYEEAGKKLYNMGEELKD